MTSIFCNLSSLNMTIFCLCVTVSNLCDSKINVVDVSYFGLCETVFNNFHTKTSNELVEKEIKRWINNNQNSSLSVYRHNQVMTMSFHHLVNQPNN